MTVLSKLSCHYVIHPWTSSCVDQVLEIMRASYWSALKTYLIFYCATLLLKRKRLKYLKERYLLDVLRSTNFLAINAWGFTSLACVFANLLGGIYYYSTGFLPGFLASFVAISTENPSRRRPLAVYMSTIALDCVVRGLRTRKLVPNVPHVDLAVFAIASALAVRLFKIASTDDNSVDILRAMRFLVGNDECRRSVTHPTQSTQPVARHLTWLDQLDSLSLWRLLPHKTHLCAHQEHTCVWYALKGAVRMAAYGAAVRLALNSISLLRMRSVNVQEVLRRVLRDVGALSSFLGTYVLAVRSISCVLRRATGKDEAWHGAVAGLGAAMSMKFYRSLELSVFILSRIADYYYEVGMQGGYLPSWSFGTTVLYAISTAVMFHVAIFEPQNMKPSYRASIIFGLSGGRFDQLNRRLFCEVSSQSAHYRPDYWPQYDPSSVPEYMLTDRALKVLGLES